MPARVDGRLVRRAADCMGRVRQGGFDSTLLPRPTPLRIKRIAAGPEPAADNLFLASAAISSGAEATLRLIRAPRRADARSGQGNASGPVNGAAVRSEAHSAASGDLGRDLAATRAKPCKGRRRGAQNRRVSARPVTGEIGAAHRDLRLRSGFRRRLAGHYRDGERLALQVDE